MINAFGTSVPNSDYNETEDDYDGDQTLLHNSIS